MAAPIPTALFFGKQTIQVKVEIPPATHDDQTFYIPEEWEDWYLKKLGFVKGIPVDEKLLEELFEEGKLHSVSSTFGTWPFPTAGVRFEAFVYIPSALPGERLGILVDGENENAVNAAILIVSLNFAYSMTT